MNPLLQETITVKELLEQHPNLLQTFMDMKLTCVGCPAEGFHTLANVAHAFGLARRAFIASLQEAIAAAGGHQPRGTGTNP